MNWLSFAIGATLAAEVAVFVHLWIIQPLELQLEYAQRRSEDDIDRWLSEIGGVLRESPPIFPNPQEKP